MARYTDGDLEYGNRVVTMIELAEDINVSGGISISTDEKTAEDFDGNDEPIGSSTTAGFTKGSLNGILWKSTYTEAYFLGGHFELDNVMYRIVTSTSKEMGDTASSKFSLNFIKDLNYIAP